MKELLKITKYQLNDVIRSKWILVYAGFYLLTTYGLIAFTNSPTKVLITLMNIILVIVPLVGIIFGVIFLYNNRDNITFLSAQPLKRQTLFTGMLLGSTIPLCGSLVFGISFPIIFYYKVFVDHISIVILLLFSAVMLTLVFSGISFLISIKNEDKLKGLGIAVFVWLLLAIIYDGIVMMILQTFQDYPLEIPSLALSILNPIDLARITLILKFDISALLGYTGAVFNSFFSGIWGSFVAGISILFWVFIPIYFALRSFLKKDF